MRSEGLALMRAGLQAQFDDSARAPPPRAARAAAPPQRKAAYSAALATRSSYAGRLNRSAPGAFAPPADRGGLSTHRT